MLKMLCCSGLVILLLGSCINNHEQIKPAEEKITESVYASGIIKSKNQYQVFASANGIVAEIFVTEGDMIRKGDPLMRVSDITAQLNTANAKLAAEYSSVQANTEKLNEAKINIDQAKIKMDNDALLLQRQQNLWAEQIGTKNELDQREQSYKSSVNAYDAARLRYAELQKQVNFQAEQSRKTLAIAEKTAGDYTVRSETDGKVYSMLKEKGEMVNAQTPLALVGDATDFTLELEVDEYDISRIRAGQKILLNMDSYKGQVFEAVVEKIDPLMNDRSKSFTVEARFIRRPPILYPNLTCEANIVIQEKEKALTIPRNYLLDDQYVMLKDKEKRKVVTGLKDYQKVEIISGLTAGDIILKPEP